MLFLFVLPRLVVVVFVNVLVGHSWMALFRYFSEWRAAAILDENVVAPISNIMCSKTMRKGL